MSPSTCSPNTRFGGNPLAVFTAAEGLSDAEMQSLTDHDQISYEVTQGVEMSRPSNLAVRAWRTTDGGIRASVGGSCVPVLRGEAML